MDNFGVYLVNVEKEFEGGFDNLSDTEVLNLCEYSMTLKEFEFALNNEELNVNNYFIRIMNVNSISQ